MSLLTGPVCAESCAAAADVGFGLDTGVAMSVRVGDFFYHSSWTAITSVDTVNTVNNTVNTVNTDKKMPFTSTAYCPFHAVV